MTTCCRLLVVAVSLLVAATHAAESPVKHFIMVMLENRGFDHRLGWLQQLGYKIDGLSGNEFNYLVPGDANSGVCKVTDTADPYNTTDAGHSYDSTLHEQFGSNRTSPGAPPMDGFASNNGNCLPMQCIPTADIPVSRAMLDNFAVIDRWFPGFPGPTEVNRMFVHSAQSAGYCTNPSVEEYILGYPQESLFHRLTKSNVTWNVYMMDDISTALFFRDQRTPEAIRNYHPYDKFEKDCREGKLAQYTVIEPRFFSVPGYPATDEHPSGHSIHQGELMMKRIYDTLRASPQWNESALLFTYDEHGGLYDHVPSPNGDGIPPPIAGQTCVQGGDPKFDFTRLGVRVPAVLVSPWVPRGLVVHEPTNGPQPTSQWEHSSVPATVHDLFGTDGYLTARDAWAASLAPLFSLSAPRTDCPESMPEPPAAAADLQREADSYMQPLNDLQRSLITGMAALLGERHDGRGLHTELQGAEFVAKAWRLFRSRVGV